MYRIESEFQKLKKRYKLGEIKLGFDRIDLTLKGYEAVFNWWSYKITLKDRCVCKTRLLGLLHEICHVKQFQEGKLIMNRRDTRKMYLQEFEAEIFSIDEYEALYAPEFGSCLNDFWTLETYDAYKKFFKKQIK
jgi:hypothetical protein